MTRPLIWIFVPVAALVLADRPASAQSPYSYPWCLEYGIGGALSCYFSSYEQCWYEAYTRGGFCKQSPYYGRSLDGFVGAGSRSHRRHRPHS